jgi:hypothetical protein
MQVAVVAVAIKAGSTQTVLDPVAVAITPKMHKVLIKVTADQVAAALAETSGILTKAEVAPAVLLQ